MNLIPKEHALRLLEAQRVTGGLIDPNKNYRIDTLKKAVFAGLISQKIADELEKDSPTFKGRVVKHSKMSENNPEKFSPKSHLNNPSYNRFLMTSQKVFWI